MLKVMSLIVIAILFIYVAISSVVWINDWNTNKQRQRCEYYHGVFTEDKYSKSCSGASRSKENYTVGTFEDNRS